MYGLVQYVECCFALVGLGSAAVIYMYLVVVLIYMYLVVSLPANKSSVFYLSPSPKKNENKTIRRLPEG